MDLIPIEEIKNQVEADLESAEKQIAEQEEKSLAAIKQFGDNLPKSTQEDDIVTKQRKKDLEAIAQNEQFQKQSLDINMRDVGAQLLQRQNEIEDKELRNELDRYRLKKEKEKLDYRTKKEKNIVREEVKADVFEKKLEVAEKRYGYLYEKENDETKSMKYKNFTINKFVNRTKEFSNWYKSLSAEVRKIIWTTVKTFLIVGGIALGLYVMYELIRALATSGLVI